MTLPSPTHASTLFGATDEPMTPRDFRTLEVRLWITVICGSVSIIGGLMMQATYRRYRQQLTSPLNDLYVLGLGGMQLLQTVQFVIFAAIHLGDLHNFTGPMCAANAMLDQFFNFSGQMFAFGFMVSLFTLRGHFDCCSHTSVSLSEQGRGGGTFLPLTRSQHFRHRSYGSKLTAPDDLCPDDDDARVTERPVLTPRIPAMPVEQQAPLSALDRGDLARVVWAVLAIGGGIGTTVWMSVQVMSDPGAAPQDHVSHPTNFEVGLGWCWIPEGFDNLRLFCGYLLALMTLLAGVAALFFLLRHEVGASYQLHMMIYVRVCLLLSWLLIAYLIGAVSRFTKDHTATEQSSYVATALYTLNEAFVAAIFIGTERMWSPIRDAVMTRFQNDPEEVPGNGFSSCVNHLLLIEVVGVPLPLTAPSAETSRWRFESDADGVGWSANSRRLISSQRQSLVIASEASTEALLGR